MNMPEQIISQTDWDKVDHLLPVIVQDADSKDVLMLGYMNHAALLQTYTDNKVTFYSRRKQRIWQKGETSGHYLELISASLDCDNDALLVKAKPKGPTCHTGSETCFGARAQTEAGFLGQLEKIIYDRKDNPDEGSYTSQLLTEGLNKIGQKVGEEAVETVIAALNESDEAVLSESADLLFHLMVMLSARKLSLAKVIKKLQDRHNKNRPDQED